MVYVVMCGGNYHTAEPKQLKSIKGERIVERTIRLLKQNGVKEIYVSTNDERFDYLLKLGVKLIRHHNTFGDGGHWLEAFAPIDEPVCYIFGDVVFSPEAIKTIVETETDFIQFFASSPPYDPRYFKNWAEPYAFKVMQPEMFHQYIKRTLELVNCFYRDPIAWELWQVIKGTPLGHIDYTNYVAINDYTCDVDCEADLERLKEVVE